MVTGSIQVTIRKRQAYFFSVRTNNFESVLVRVDADSTLEVTSKQNEVTEKTEIVTKSVYQKNLSQLLLEPSSFDLLSNWSEFGGKLNPNLPDYNFST